MPNLQMSPKRDLSSFRRIALGTWRTAYDPSVYGHLSLRVDDALKYINEFREKTGKRLTLTHLVAKSIAATLAEMPDANAILRFNRIYLREKVSVFFQIAIEDKETGELDLSGAVIEDADKKNLNQILDEMNERIRAVREGTDKELESTRNMFKKIPFFLLHWVLQTISFLGYTLNLDLRAFGVPRDPFGSVMVTNIGSLGLEAAYAPLVPYSRVPLLIAMGSTRDEPVVVNGEVTVGKIMKIFVTFDHRILDGSHAAKMAKTMREWIEDPYNHFDQL